MKWTTSGDRSETIFKEFKTPVERWRLSTIYDKIWVCLNHHHHPVCPLGCALNGYAKVELEGLSRNMMFGRLGRKAG